MNVRRFLFLSAQEWLLVILGVAGAFILRFLYPRLWWRLFITSYGLGFTFEASMARLFTYDKSLSEKHCVENSDVNFLLGLGWIEIGALSALLEHYLFGHHLWWTFGLSTIVGGNINEFLFYKVGCWRYNYNEPMFGKFRPLWPKITVWGVPVQVILGYFNVGLMVWFVCKVLF